MSLWIVQQKIYRFNDLELSLIHISEPTRLLSISYAVFCLKKKLKNLKVELAYKPGSV